VSANYCQSGRNQKIFTIGICDKSECKLTRNSYISEEDLETRKQMCSLTDNYNNHNEYINEYINRHSNIYSDDISHSDSDSDYYI